MISDAHPARAGLDVLGDGRACSGCSGPTWPRTSVVRPPARAALLLRPARSGLGLGCHGRRIASRPPRFAPDRSAVARPVRSGVHGDPGAGHRQLRLVRLQPRPGARRARGRPGRPPQRRHRRGRHPSGLARRHPHLARARAARGRPASAWRWSRELAGEIPILGVCLGHQAIGQVYGGEVVAAPTLMHGKTSAIHHDGDRGLRRAARPVRGHPLPLPGGGAGRRCPTSWRSPPRPADGVIMGLRHRTLAVEGVQFHPESLPHPGGARACSPTSWPPPPSGAERGGRPDRDGVRMPARRVPDGVVAVATTAGWWSNWRSVVVVVVRGGGRGGGRAAADP